MSSRTFAWITLLTGLALSGVAGFYSVIGLSTIFIGAFWSVVVLAALLEVAKLVSVSWMYRYRHLAGPWVRLYFYGAILVTMLLTSLGIFGHLSRAHVTTEAGMIQAELTLDTIRQREQQLMDQRTQLQQELATATAQDTQLLTQLGSAERLTGTNGAVSVQRQSAARRDALLQQIQTTTTNLAALQQERVTVETDTAQATADLGPLRYLAQALYGGTGKDAIQKAVLWLTFLLMVVFDPLAIALLIAANILFSQNAPESPTTGDPASKGVTPTKRPKRPVAAATAGPEPHPESFDILEYSTDIPRPLHRTPETR